jgi:hypothetical protein
MRQAIYANQQTAADEMSQKINSGVVRDNNFAPEILDTQTPKKIIS